MPLCHFWCCELHYHLQAQWDASSSREQAGKVITAEEEAGAAVLLLAPLCHVKASAKLSLQCTIASPAPGGFCKVLELASLLLTPLGFRKAAISSVPSLFFFFFFPWEKGRKKPKGK